MGNGVIRGIGFTAIGMVDTYSPSIKQV